MIEGLIDPGYLHLAQKCLSEYRTQPHLPHCQASLRQSVNMFLGRFQLLPARSSIAKAYRIVKSPDQAQRTREEQLHTCIEFIQEACLPDLIHPTHIMPALGHTDHQNMAIGMHRAFMHMGFSNPSRGTSAYFAALGYSTSVDAYHHHRADKLFSVALNYPRIREAFYAYSRLAGQGNLSNPLMAQEVIPLAHQTLDVWNGA